ncbi:antibiotic biosynthesis monooxygenase family protein [Paraburkholderia tropica]|uniref:antibiotic biosynthesis monooxygenase family protein n=1 Tax=Paraburkholderia tropica TaxID=92647 RepID=UPI002AB78B6F|nr:antibiotic biosynthesis monooxygenase [Paraburkholderia tropica]
MILELAHFRIQPGANAAFEAAFAAAQELLTVTPGYRDDTLQLCIEDASEYRLLVQWNSVDDHMHGFRGSPRFAQWRALLSPFFVAPPSASHYKRVFPDASETCAHCSPTFQLP